MDAREKVDIEVNDKLLYEEIAEYYSTKDLNKYAKVARNLRLTQTLAKSTISSSTDNLSFLELGCGAGFSAKYLNGKYRKFIGVDYSSKLIDYANKHNKINEKTDFITSNIKDLPSSAYDGVNIVFMIGVLHHMTDREEALLSIYQNMDHGSELIMNEPHDSNPVIRMLRGIRTKVDKTYSSDQMFFTYKVYEEIMDKTDFEYEFYPQGIFSTPFAETTLLPELLGASLVRILVQVDRFLEKILPKGILKYVTWNLIIRAAKA